MIEPLRRILLLENYHANFLVFHTPPHDSDSKRCAGMATRLKYNEQTNLLELIEWIVTIKPPRPPLSSVSVHRRYGCAQSQFHHPNSISGGGLQKVVDVILPVPDRLGRLLAQRLGLVLSHTQDAREGGHAI